MGFITRIVDEESGEPVKTGTYELVFTRIVVTTSYGPNPYFKGDPETEELQSGIIEHVVRPEDADVTLFHEPTVWHCAEPGCAWKFSSGTHVAGQKSLEPVLDANGDWWCENHSSPIVQETQWVEQCAWQDDCTLVKVFPLGQAPTEPWFCTAHVKKICATKGCTNLHLVDPYSPFCSEHPSQSKAEKVFTSWHQNVTYCGALHCAAANIHPSPLKGLGFCSDHAVPLGNGKFKCKTALTPEAADYWDAEWDAKVADYLPEPDPFADLATECEECGKSKGLKTYKGHTLCKKHFEHAYNTDFEKKLYSKKGLL